MNCRDLYAMNGTTNDWVSDTLEKFFEYDEIIDKDGIYSIDEEILKRRVAVKDIVSYCFDGRRVWILKSLWFDNEPFAIMQEGGREGDDHRDRYISNGNLFKQCVDFINSLMQPKVEEINDLIDEDEDIVSLTCFYGYELQDFIEEGYDPKYKNGTEVEIELSPYYSWTKPLAEKDMLIQKATVVREKKCKADSTLVEIHEYYDHKKSLWGLSNNKHISELGEEDIEEYTRKTIWVDDNLKQTYR